MKNFLLGILLGGLGVYFFFNSPEKSKPQPISSVGLHNLNIATNEESPKTEIKGKTILPTRVKLSRIDSAKKLEYNATLNSAIEKPEKKLMLNLNRRTIQNLEVHWDQLPEHAGSKRLDEGWQVNFKRRDSIFKNLGFKNGDIVNYNSLETSELSVGQAELMEKVIAILRHIEE